MPIGAKDILLVIRATDQASATISRVAGSFGNISAAQATAATNTLKHGAALTMLGAGLIAVGKQGFDALSSWKDAAIDYNHQASLTLTQLDDTGVSLEEIKKIGRDVAMAIPAPFDEMQTALYDIFSSMDVGTKEAQTLLEAFSKGAVAGQTDIQTAARGSMAVMNAYKIPVGDVNKVMDTQFQLVRKGVGTYEEFANVIGRVAPSAVRMGQTFEATAGALAFLTRNGQSTEMASTSLGRALDALSKIKVQERLTDMGVASRDAQGNFLPLVDIVGQMNDKFKDLSKPERAKALEELFKGAGGTIQARRFFDTVFDNFDQFQQLTTEMAGSAGEMEDAYNTMFESPQTKMQLFKNRLDVIRTELGDHLLPVMTKVIDIGLKLTDWFEGLDPAVKKNIVTVVALASGAMVLVGSIFALIGVFLIIKATLALAAVSFAAVGLAAIGIIAAIAAVAAIGYLIYRNWDTLGPIFEKVFNILKEKAQQAWEKLQEFYAWVMTWWPGVWENIKQKAGEAWAAIQVGAQIAWDKIQEVVAWLVANVPPVWEKIQEGASNLWQGAQAVTADFLAWYQEHVAPVIESFVQMVQDFANRVRVIWDWLWANLSGPVSMAWENITAIVAVAWMIIQQAFGTGRDIVMAVWEPLWTTVKEVAFVAWEYIKQTIQNALDIIGGIFDIFSALFRGDWGGMWEGVKAVAAGAWAQITNTITTAWDLLFALCRGAMSTVWQIIQAGWDRVLGYMRTVPGLAWNAAVGLISTLWDLGNRAMDNMRNAVVNGFVAVHSFFLSLPGKAVSAMGGIGSTFYEAGARMIDGLINALVAGAGRVYSTAKGIADRAVKGIKDALSIFSPSRVMYGLGNNTVQGLINGITAMGPDVERTMRRMAKTMTATDLTVPVGWSVEGGASGGRGPGAGSVALQVDLDIIINGANLSADDIGEIAAKKVKDGLTEVYRELLTGPRR